MPYLDHNASAPMRPEATAALVEALEAAGGNPNSGHSRARRARDYLEGARRRVARALGSRRSEIVFTSGGTESNNLAITGLYRARLAGDPDRRRVVTCATEHPAVLATVESLAAWGAEPVVLGVDGSGRLDLDAVSEALTAETALCAVMLANNETGVLHDVPAIAERCRAVGVPLHCDAVQGVGKVPIHLSELGATTVGFTAHKLGGPIGIGALYVSRGARVVAQVRGGSQEGGLRPGTQAYALAHGFAAALETALSQLDRMATEVAGLRDAFEAALLERFDGCWVWGAEAPRLPNTSFVALPGFDGGQILLALDERGVQVGTGAACGTGDRTPSHVLTAMGASPAQAHATLRFSLGSETVADEMEAVALALDAVTS